LRIACLSAQFIRGQVIQVFVMGFIPGMDTVWGVGRNAANKQFHEIKAVASRHTSTGIAVAGLFSERPIYTYMLRAFQPGRFFSSTRIHFSTVV